MSLHASSDDLGPVLPLNPLEAARADCRAKAALEMRRLQIWSGCYAAMLEAPSTSDLDLLNVDAGFSGSVGCTAAALQTFFAALESKGTA